MYGLGQPDFTSALGKFVYVEPLTFELNGEGGAIISEKFVKGRKVIAGSLLDAERFKLRVGIQAASFTALAFAMGQVTKTTTSINLPDVIEARVPLVAPFEIANPAIATSAGVWAFQVDPIDIALTLSAGVPAAGAFQIDVPGSKLVFNAAQAGASVVYRVFKTYSNVRTVGKEPLLAADLLNNLSFSGAGYTDGKRCKIIIPKMNRVSVPSLSLSDVTTLEVEYQLAVAAGEENAFYLVEID